MHDIQNRRHTSFNIVCTPSMRGLRCNQIGENVRNHTFVNRVSRAMLKHVETWSNAGFRKLYIDCFNGHLWTSLIPNKCWCDNRSDVCLWQTNIFPGALCQYPWTRSVNIFEHDQGKNGPLSCANSMKWKKQQVAHRIILDVNRAK